MNTVFLVVAFVFVFSVVAVAAYAVFELTPLAHHKDRYRDASGNRRFDSPHVD
jgi:hypothetical protein